MPDRIKEPSQSPQGYLGENHSPWRPKVSDEQSLFANASEKCGKRRGNLFTPELRLAVAIGSRVESVPLFAQTERVGAIRSIDRQHAIQMVDLVLQQFSAVALELDLMGISLEILIPNPQVIGPLYPDQEVGEGETVVPDREILGPDIDDLRIDQSPRLIHFDLDDSYWRTYLRGGNGATAPESGLPVPERFPQVIDDDPYGG